MHECYAMQILETKKIQNQRTMVIKSIAMKHKDHVIQEDNTKTEFASFFLFLFLF